MMAMRARGGRGGYSPRRTRHRLRRRLSPKTKETLGGGGIKAIFRRKQEERRGAKTKVRENGVSPPIWKTEK